MTLFEGFCQYGLCLCQPSHMCLLVGLCASLWSLCCSVTISMPICTLQVHHCVLGCLVECGCLAACLQVNQEALCSLPATASVKLFICQACADSLSFPASELGPHHCGFKHLLKLRLFAVYKCSKSCKNNI